ncbi:alpha/beta fold hydrolase [Flavilitoribacter nigricans]|uniref:Alpha/beta hydrolase n=1 Tax=Flavilitoribacter nigricans (strain ATCC 23147 / DSM 23189 / NBRC 102662 / NCIMB 1420 / SS-2) TaxID=1122177 RepID=A0A2D0N588_FLAN2|nr:alpha/beta hydrolase [Flavilitoribacter nigricans]PHN03664.1 alpha/beta hydrolase [Flavilitoribacter nigricans DSM 23189 = NBRC 102662]
MSQFVQIGDQRLHYEQQGSGYPLVMLHGWGCDLHIFDRLVPDLEQHFTVYRLDFPGFGQSPEPDSAWGTERYAELTIDFLNALDIRHPILIGHSFGGRVIIRLAERVQPRKVIITGGAGIKPVRPLSYYVKVYSYKTMKWLAGLPVLKSLLAGTMEQYRRKSGSSDYQQASEVMRGVLVKAVNEDLSPLLSSVKAPTLLIWGERDTATPLRDGKLMETLIPDAGLVVFDGGTHYAFLEQAPRFLTIVNHFLEKEKQIEL